MEKLDLSALESLNIPEIKADPKNEVNILTPEDAADIKEDIIQEVDSLESFNAPKENAQEVVETTEEPDELEEIPLTNDSEKEISIVKGLADWAREEKLFDYADEEFEDNTDFLVKKLNEVADQRAEAKLKELPEVIYELAKNYQEGVPLEELIYSKSREIEYNNITKDQISENKELQKKLVSDWLYNTDPDITEEKLAKKLQKYEDSLILEDEAEEAHEKLKVFEQKYQVRLKEEQKQRNEQSAKEYKEKLSQMEQEITSAQEIIPGVELTPDEKKKVFEAYTKLDSKGETALIKKIKADPKSWYKITQFMVLMDGNLDKVKSTLKTKVAQEAKKTVNTYKEQTVGKLDLNTVKKSLALLKKRHEI